MRPAAILLLLVAAACGGEVFAEGDTTALSAAVKKGSMSLEEALQQRRSVRTFQARALTQAEIDRFVEILGRLG